MNKVVTIHLNGTAFQLEEAGYEALRAYLDDAARKLAANPDRDEILADIEQAIADKCRAVTTDHRTVVLSADLEHIIGEMGPIDSGGSAATETESGGPAAGSSQTPPPRDSASSSAAGSYKRLYRVPEGAMIAGVCSGIAAYFNVDPTIIRIAFVLLAFVTAGGMILAYFLLAFILPPAETSAEKAAAHGIPATAQEFIRRAREGYYGATRTFHDKASHKAWKRKFKRDMQDWSHNFGREMQAQTRHWQATWHDWASHPGAYRGLWFTGSLLALMSAGLTFVWIFAIISLLTTGAVFGLSLPVGIPLWAGLLLLCFLFAILNSPLGAARHAIWRHGWGGPPFLHPLWGLWSAILWLGFLAFLIWFANRYVPHAHESLMNVPPALHHAADSIREWWSRR
ncbi:MAG TPA: PspC domain-containing protein [Opitutus sp.]|nr:PspC domain-containing protein [Opitutus sp.]